MNRKLSSVVFVSLALILPAYPQVRGQAISDSSRFDPLRQNLQLKLSPAEVSTNVKTQQGRSVTSAFGIDLFDRDFANLQQGYPEVYVLPPNYKLGPGDKLGVFLLGKVQENREVVVNVEGKVFVPPAGVLHARGLSMDEFKDLLTRKLSKFYDNFQLDMMLLQPKNVLISVVGEVVQPGKYVLSAMNTVFDAITQAGGPTGKGSIRDIQLIRDGEVTASIDLYPFLLRGVDDNDHFLQAGDRVLVPLALSKVTIAGEVNRPHTFELKPGANERVSDLIELAGGFTEYVYPNKIEISRLLDNAHRELMYVDYHDITAGKEAADLRLRNEDRIRVYSKLEQVHARAVTIFGEIRKPGTYALEENMHLSDLLLKAGNVTRKAYTLEAEVAKVNPGLPTEYIKVNLEGLTNGSNGHSDLLLEEDDQVFVRQIPEWEIGLTVDVRGEVMFPGTYAIVKNQTRLSDILEKVGGFTEDAFLQEATLIRPNKKGIVDKEFERLKAMQREHMTDLEYQYLVMRDNTTDVNRVVVDFEKLAKGKDTSQDVLLEDGDIIDIPKAPKVVTVSGSVANAGGVTYTPDGNLKYYIARAGGASWDANLKKAKVIKVTGEVLDDEDVDRFEPGDIIWVPRKTGRKVWPTILQSIAVAAQLASIYLIIDTARNR